MASSPSPDSSPSAVTPAAATTSPPPPADATPLPQPPSSPPLETPSQTKANPPDAPSPPPPPPTAAPLPLTPPPPTGPPPDPPAPPTATVSTPPSEPPPPSTPPPPDSSPPPPVTPPPSTPVPVTPPPSPPPPVTPTPTPTQPSPSDPPASPSPPPPVKPPKSPTVPPPVSSPPQPSPKPTPTVPPPESPPPPPPKKPTSSPAPPPPVEPPHPPPLPSSKVSPPSKSPPPLQPSSPPASPITPSNATTSPPPAAPLSPPSTPAANGPTPSTSFNDRGNSGIETGGMVAIVVIGLVVFASIIVGFAAWCNRKRRRKVNGLDGVYVVPSSISPSDSSAKNSHPAAPLIGSGGSGSDIGHSPRQPSGLGNSRPWFTYEELIQVTNGFSPQNLLGEGGFGCVFKGNLPDGREIAVKQLKVGGSQGEREFRSEVEIISRIHHRHLVALVGYCIADSQRLLVYDYVPNNTLYFHLHGEGRPVLEWAKRVRIAAGAARGLAYLHEDCHPRVFHRDIKSSNILLDNKFEARVSDFGLAKLALDANTHVTTRVMGTFGYMAPEYALSGKLTEKSDVYSFGVVILELVTGRKPVDTSQPLGDESLVEWARLLLSHALDNEEFEGLADPRLEKNYVESEMFRMIEVAAACVRHSAAKRPGMGQVVRAFDNLATADLTNGMKVGESEVFNSAEQSAEIRLFRRMAFGSQDCSTDYFSRTSSTNI